MSITNYQTEWRKKNKDKVKEQNERYRARLQMRRVSDLVLDKKLRERQSANNKKYRYDRLLREKILIKLGRKCGNPACQWLNADGSRGCTDSRCLQVDHVYGGGKQELKSMCRRSYLRKVLADVDGIYQLLCANCNWIKRSENQEM